MLTEKRLDWQLCVIQHQVFIDACISCHVQLKQKKEEELLKEQKAKEEEEQRQEKEVCDS